jgi:hypothetical protein
MRETNPQAAKAFLRQAFPKTAAIKSKTLIRRARTRGIEIRITVVVLKGSDGMLRGPGHAVVLRAR